MVRFSDMLGGNGDPDATPATAPAPPPSLVGLEPDEPEPDDEPEPAGAAAPVESPEEVLDRLTQYASSARTTDTPEPEPEPPIEAPAAAGDAEDDLRPVGDDLLPRPKAETRKRRRN
jgi:hypothetical protein